MAGNKATVVYTDGACSLPRIARPDGRGFTFGSEGVGGWAWWVNDSLWDRGSLAPTTINRMELLAVIQTLQSPHIDRDYPVTIVSDSTYVVNGATLWLPNWVKRGWRSKGREVSNRDYWEKVSELLEGRAVSFLHVRAHTGNFGNVRADSLAVSAKKMLQRELREESA